MTDAEQKAKEKAYFDVLWGAPEREQSYSENTFGIGFYLMLLAMVFTAAFFDPIFALPAGFAAVIAVGVIAGWLKDTKLYANWERSGNIHGTMPPHPYDD